MTNPTVILPARVRGVLYLVFAILSLGIGATIVGYATAEAGQPVWLRVLTAVIAFVGSGLGLTAASNTPNAPSSQLTPNTPPTDGSEGEGDDAGEEPAG